MDIISPVIEFMINLVYTFVDFLKSITFAPGVTWWSISIVFMLIGVTISLFVRTGKA